MPRQIIDFVRSSYAGPPPNGNEKARSLTEKGIELARRRQRINTEDYDLGITSACKHAIETLEIIGDFFPRDGHGFRTQPKVLNFPELFSTGNTIEDEIMGKLFHRLKSYHLESDKLIESYRNMSHQEEDIFRSLGRQAWYLIRENVVENNTRSTLVVVHKHTAPAILSAANRTGKYENLYLGKWWSKCEGVRTLLQDGEICVISPLPTIDQL